MKKAFFFIALGAMLLISGCVSVGQSADGTLPWSEPQPWEGQVLGVPLQ